MTDILVTGKQCLDCLRLCLSHLVYSCCVLVCTVQICLIISGHIWPDTTNTVSYQELLHQDKFPVLIKVCVQPGFDTVALQQAGYNGSVPYFHGQSKYNSSVFGWAGHGQDGVQNQTAEGKIRKKDPLGL